MSFCFLKIFSTQWSTRYILLYLTLSNFMLWYISHLYAKVHSDINYKWKWTEIFILQIFRKLQKKIWWDLYLLIWFLWKYFQLRPISLLHGYSKGDTSYHPIYPLIEVMTISANAYDKSADSVTNFWNKNSLFLFWPLLESTQS